MGGISEVAARVLLVYVPSDPGQHVLDVRGVEIRVNLAAHVGVVCPDCRVIFED